MAVDRIGPIGRRVFERVRGLVAKNEPGGLLVVDCFGSNTCQIESCSILKHHLFNRVIARVAIKVFDSERLGAGIDQQLVIARSAVAERDITNAEVREDKRIIHITALAPDRV